MSTETWKTQPVTPSEWTSYFLWIDRMILRVNADERTDYRKLMSNINSVYREYLNLEHQSRLKVNPISSKNLADSKLNELHDLVKFLGDSLMMSRLMAL